MLHTVRMVIAIALALGCASVYGQNLAGSAPNVFLDCQTRCYLSHIRTQLNYVNFVRDRQEADIYMFLTSLRTGSGGLEYTLESTGFGDFEGISTIADCSVSE